MLRSLLLALLLLPQTALAYGEEEKALGYVQSKQWSNAEAAALGVRDPLVRDVVEFYLLRDSPQMADFGEYATFLRRHPDWPNTEKLNKRAEIALITENAAPALAADWFASHPPITARGKFIVAEASGRPSQQAVRNAWAQGDFTDIEEARILSQYGNLLRPQDHYARVDRLLWDGQIAKARRLYPRISAGQQIVCDARIALMQKAKNADGLVARVPAALRRDPGLVFERIRFRHDKGLKDDVPELLALAPKQPPYPARWWPYRKYAIREAIDDGLFGMAANLASEHGQTDKVERSEALFLHGWIDLAFRQKPAAAYNEFARLYETVEFPISRSRAAWWAATAAKAAGRSADAKRWTEIAAQYPMFFFGQLAQEQLYGNAPLRFPTSHDVSESDWQQASRKDKRVQLSMNLARYGFSDLAAPFVTHMAKSASTAREAGIAIMTGRKMGRIDLSVRAAKEALNNGFFFRDALFPRYPVKSPLAVEKALAFAIARQESMFYPAARSSANAIGMMQLLPSTAKLTAKKNGVPYDEARLKEPEYNFRLGSQYLDSLLQKFSKAHVYAIASYNAGPGRPLQWQARYGSLGNDTLKNIDWIERIPFNETRNYVQRVLENYQVYRWLDSGGKAKNTSRQLLDG